jgi:hypothetical protein
MAYKLIDAVQARWRAVDALHSVALVKAGALFHKGKLLERPVEITPGTVNRTPGDRSRLTTPNPQDMTIPPGPDLRIQTNRPIPLVTERGGSVHP